MSRRRVAAILFALVVVSGLALSSAADRSSTPPSAPSAVAEPTPQGQVLVPPAALPGPQFDIERATRAYLDSLPSDARTKSDAYFEGGYWLRLWSYIWGLAVAGLLLFGRLSARLRNAVERWTSRTWLQTIMYAAFLIVLVSLLTLPWSLYTSWYREHQYGLSNLTLAAWFGERAKGLLISVLIGAPAVAVIYAVVRRRRGNWWLPAAALSVIFLLVVTFISPVFITPVFNRFQPLAPSPVRDSVLGLARANGVPAHEVYWFDASRQTKRISANVSGLGDTTRISLNDNLLRDTSLPEIRAVMAHELGHYVLHHGLKLVLAIGFVLAVGLAFSQWAQQKLVARYGPQWGLRDSVDIAGLPLVIVLLSTWFFLMTPVMNSIVRIVESEADIFGLNAAREPHGFASASMRLATYRKLEPTPLEEIIFYDHPSGRTRVRMSMRWAAENPDAGAAASAR